MQQHDRPIKRGYYLSPIVPYSVNIPDETSGGFTTATAMSSGSRHRALLLTLQPRVYRFIAAGKAGASGIVLLDVYDADATTSSSRFVNISTRAYSMVGKAPAIGG